MGQMAEFAPAPSPGFGSARPGGWVEASRSKWLPFGDCGISDPHVWLCRAKRGSFVRTGNCAKPQTRHLVNSTNSPTSCLAWQRYSKKNTEAGDANTPFASRDVKRTPAIFGSPYFSMAASTSWSVRSILDQTANGGSKPRNSGGGNLS